MKKKFNKNSRCHGKYLANIYRVERFNKNGVVIKSNLTKCIAQKDNRDVMKINLSIRIGQKDFHKYRDRMKSTLPIYVGQET